MKFLADAFEKLCESPADKAARRFRERDARLAAARKAPVATVPQDGGSLLTEYTSPSKNGMTFNSLANPETKYD